MVGRTSMMVALVMMVGCGPVPPTQGLAPFDPAEETSDAGNEAGEAFARDGGAVSDAGASASSSSSSSSSSRSSSSSSSSTTSSTWSSSSSTSSSTIASSSSSVPPAIRCALTSNDPDVTGKQVGTYTCASTSDFGGEPVVGITYGIADGGFSRCSPTSPATGYCDGWCQVQIGNVSYQGQCM